MMVWFITLCTGFLYGKTLSFIFQHLSLKGPFYLRTSVNPYFMKAKFALLYQILPFLGAFVFVIAFSFMPNRTYFFIFIVITTYALLLSFYDIHYFLLPDYLTLSLFSIGSIFCYYQLTPGPLLLNLATALILGTVLFITNFCFYWIRKAWGMGLGDIKLLMALCFWFNPLHMISIIIVATASALLWIIITWCIKRKILLKIPFGPFILFGAWTILIYNLSLIL